MEIWRAKCPKGLVFHIFEKLFGSINIIEFIFFGGIQVYNKNIKKLTNCTSKSTLADIYIYMHYEKLNKKLNSL